MAAERMADMVRAGTDRDWTGLPEANVAAFSFLLHFPWEIWQMPLYRCLEGSSYVEAVRSITQASVGDAAISVVAFWAVSVGSRSRDWILNSTPREITGFLGTGVAITIVFEWLATEVLDRWQYAPGMPTLPLLGTGLTPLFQWILLPPLVVWLARRQLIATREIS